MRHVRFDTLGCRLNHAETEELHRSFEKHGFQVAGEKDQVDVCVVNTCTVTTQVDAKNRQLIRSLHRQYPLAKIAVVGCYAQMEAEKISKMEGVSLVVGNQEKMRLGEYLVESEEIGTTTIVLPRIRRKSFHAPVLSRHEDILRVSGKKQHRKDFRTRASLKIQDGCDFMCSFCIIPFARGRSRYRDFTNLIENGKMLTSEGVREIVLTGVNIGTYQESGRTFLHVIDALDRLKGVSRIRISSIEPTTMPHGVLDRMADPLHKLVPFLHLPIQSGSNTILEAMKRRYTSKDYESEVINAWKRVPGLGLGTDVMTGFPGETETHHNESMELLKQLPLNYFHVFPFSARKGTQAFKNEEQLDPQEIRSRSREMRELSDQKRRAKNEALIGSVEEVLFESRKPNGSQSGYTSGYTRVTLLDNGREDHRNKILPVRIKSIQGPGVYGKLERK